MKKITFILISLITMICCVSCSKTPYTADDIEVTEACPRNVGKNLYIIAAPFNYAGHTYIAFYYGSKRGGVVHDPDCHCHNISDNITE